MVFDVAMSPTTAKRFQMGLTQAIKVHEEANGAIPIGPDFKIETGSHNLNEPKA